MIKKVLIVFVALLLAAAAYLGVSWFALAPVYDEIIETTTLAPRATLEKQSAIEYFRPFKLGEEGSLHAKEDLIRKSSLVWPGGGSMEIGFYRVVFDDGMVRKNYDIVEVICVFEDGRFKVEKVIAQP